MSLLTPTSPELSQHRIRRKPPPTLDISERYPSPDPLDPFAPLWVLRNRTSSGLSTQDVLLSRARTTSYLYSTTTAQVSVNTSISPIQSPSQKAKISHYRPYSQTTFTDAPHAFPLISSPLASQPDLLYYQQPDRPTVVRSPRHTFDMYDSSGTESDTASVSFPSRKAFIQPKRTATSNYRLPNFLLLKKASFLGSGKSATGNRSSMIEFKQIQKSNISPPVVSTVTWKPNPVSSDSIIGQSAPKFDTAFSADLPDYGSLTLTSDEKNISHQHHKRHLMTSDVRKDLKQDLQRPRKLPSIPISPKMLRKRISSGMPFSSNVAPTTRSASSSSYVHISMPMPVLSSSQHTSEDAYISPRKAPVPPPVSVTTECPDKSCGNISTHSTPLEWDIPSRLQLNYAASLPITGDDGKQIAFGSLFESQRTIIIFIRHFWCPLCQDYMSSVKSFVRPEMVSNYEGSGDNDHHSHDRSRNQNHNGTTEGSDRIQLVVISNGAHSMIAKYRQIFGLPFKVYTDPTLALYQVLGMNRDGDIKRHNHRAHRRSTSKRGSSELTSEKNSDIRKDGGYVKHGLMGGIAMVVMRALKVCMPVWEKGGDINQLGGEFIFGPGLTCTYAHRMQTTKGHAPIQDVFQAAGISASNRIPSRAEGCRRSKTEPTILGRPTTLTSETVPRRRRESMKSFRDKESNQVDSTERRSRRYSIDMMSQEEEDKWMEYRQNSIDRLQEKKNMRRGMSRTGSSQSHWSRQALEMTLSDMGDHDQGDDRTEGHGQFTRVIEDSEGERLSPTPTPTPTPVPTDDIS